MSQGFDPSGYPDKPPASYQIKPTTVWVVPSSTSDTRLLGALRCLGVGSGNRVFCSSLTFAASVNPIRYLDAEPVFSDSDPDTWCMSPRALERALQAARREGRLPKVVLVVNPYGQSADFRVIESLCDSYGVPIVEDPAESLGATFEAHASGYDRPGRRLLLQWQQDHYDRRWR